MDVKEPKAVVFFDLDGTLLNKQSEVDAEIIETIQKLKENNVLPVICTGRSLVEITEIANKTGIDTIISLNGQHIVLNGEVIYNHPINKDVVEQLVEFAKQNGDELSFYSPDAIRVSSDKKIVHECYGLIHAPIPPIDAEYYKGKDIQMMLVIREADYLDDAYRNEFPMLEFYRNGAKAMDVITRGQSKGTGLQFLMQYLNLNQVPTYAFGDGTNDFAMFAAVDYPIAMGNAVEALKEQAIYITTNNDDHGIVNGLEHFKLLG